uniref:C2 domain-containing protein n=1 Tax=Rhizophora mucronata TaxID=61149 RepID=A0A2P2LN77_RHIMU
MGSPSVLLKIHVLRGVNLAVRDLWRRSSDPYVLVKTGKHKLKTRVVKQNLNPEWNESLTFAIGDPNLPVRLEVYDKDTFSRDDKMGNAEFSIAPFMVALKTRLSDLPPGTIITRIKPSRQNCFVRESHIIWEYGKLVQNMWLRLSTVECGEVELQLECIDIPD